MVAVINGDRDQHHTRFGRSRMNEARDGQSLLARIRRLLNTREIDSESYVRHQRRRTRLRRMWRADPSRASSVRDCVF